MIQRGKYTAVSRNRYSLQTGLVRCVDKLIIFDNFELFTVYIRTRATGTEDCFVLLSPVIMALTWWCYYSERQVRYKCIIIIQIVYVARDTCVRVLCVRGTCRPPTDRRSVTWHTFQNAAAADNVLLVCLHRATGGRTVGHRTVRAGSLRRSRTYSSRQSAASTVVVFRPSGALPTSLVAHSAFVRRHTESYSVVCLSVVCL